jgi:hypothetical protein
MAAANPDPIMVLVMGLFPSATVTDDGVLPANRASAQDGFRTRLGPIGFEGELRIRKWDKRIVVMEALPTAETLVRSEPGSRALTSSIKVSTGKE